jgi:hypothetical protein
VREETVRASCFQIDGLVMVGYAQTVVLSVVDWTGLDWTPSIVCPVRYPWTIAPCRGPPGDGMGVRPLIDRLLHCIRGLVLPCPRCPIMAASGCRVEAGDWLGWDSCSWRPVLRISCLALVLDCTTD